MGDSEADAKNDANIEIWKIKKLIKSLEAARGCAGCPHLAWKALLVRALLVGRAASVAASGRRGVHE